MMKGYSRKRASISVLVMTIGTVVIFAFLLGALIVNSSGLADNLNDVYAYGNVYAEQRGLENSMYFALVESFLNNYQKVLTDNSEKIGSENIDLNSKFGESVSGMKVEDAKRGGIVFIFDHSDTTGDGQVMDFLKSGVPSMAFDGKSASIIVDGWKTNEKKIDEDGNSNLNVDYSSSLSVNVSFGMLGLPSFDQINQIYCECVGSANVVAVEDCFKNKFSSFDISSKEQYLQGTKVISVVPSVIPSSGVGEGSSVVNSASSVSGYMQPYNVNVTLVSKDEYYIGKEMKKINFNLVFDYFEPGKVCDSLSFCKQTNTNSGLVLITS